jgi:DeoR/GlpR family transcriptional regulator of sugar metabolism
MISEGSSVNLLVMTKHGAIAAQRQSTILRTVLRSGSVRVADLVSEHGVSDMTIRRDLEVLAERGLIEKVHGGATATQLATSYEPPFGAKALRNQPEKEAIASQAATLVQPGTAVGFSAGTTVFALASRLVDVPELTVVTNSVPVAEVFFRRGRADQTVISCGGVRTPSDALVGAIAVQSLRSLNLDQVFLGVHGMSVEGGFTTPNLLEAEVDAELVARSPGLVVLADHSKWGTAGLRTIAPLEAASVVISDDGLVGDGQEALAQRAGRLVIVGVDSEEGPADARLIA